MTLPTVFIGVFCCSQIVVLLPTAKTMTNQPNPQDHKPPGLLQIILSVLAAFFGVQSERNRERDFQHGKSTHYIVVGLIMTLLLIVALVGLVKLVLHSAGV